MKPKKKPIPKTKKKPLPKPKKVDIATDLSKMVGNLSYDELTAEITTRSLYEFVKEFWDTIIHEDPVWNWHIKYICDELQAVTTGVVTREDKLHDLLINIPPGTTKSTIITIMWPAWLWAIDPTLRIISNSYSSSLSTEHASKSKDIIISHKYQRLFPHVKIRKDMSGKQAYANTRGGERHITSTGGGVTGRHAHVIISDDPQNPKQAESEAHRIQSVEHTKTLSSRKVNKNSSVTVTVMQRLATGDVSGYLLENKSEKLKHIKLPSQITSETKPIPLGLGLFYKNGYLDPIRLGPEATEEAKVDLGTRGFNGQWLQNPTVEGGDIIKKEWLRYIDRTKFDRMFYMNQSVLHFFLDTAYTEETENDPTGIVAACRIGNDVYISRVKKWYKEFPELIREIPLFTSQNGYTDASTIRIEPKASGKSVVQMLKTLTRLNVVETPVPIGSKKVRLHSKAPQVESGRVFLVEDNWNKEFVDEVTGFPNQPHDEYVDLIVYAMDYFLIQAPTAAQNILW